MIIRAKRELTRLTPNGPTMLLQLERKEGVVFVQLDQGEDWWLKQ